jgi:hypothetical protein
MLLAGKRHERNLVWAAEPDGDASPAISVRDYIDRLRYEDSLLDFIGASWRLVEPTAFLNNWHIDAMIGAVLLVNFKRQGL